MSEPVRRPVGGSVSGRSRLRGALVVIVAIGIAVWGVRTVTTSVYLVGCLVGSIAVALLARTTLLRRTGRWAAPAAAALAVVLAAVCVAVPWLAARDTADGVQWQIELRRPPVIALLVDDVVALESGGRVTLLEVATGETIETLEPGDGGVMTLESAGPDHLLVRTEQTLKLYTTSGDPLWTVDRFVDGVPGGTTAIAAHDGVVVLSSTGENPTVRGLTPDGTTAWSLEGVGYGSVEIDSPGDSSAYRLPSTAHVRLPGENAVRAFDAATGDELPVPDGMSPVAAAGTTALYTSPQANGTSECTMAAVHEGTIAWSAVMPCLDRVVLTLENRVVYRPVGAGPDNDAQEDANDEASSSMSEKVLTIDLATGQFGSVPVDPLSTGRSRDHAGSVGTDVVLTHETADLWALRATRPGDDTLLWRFRAVGPHVGGPPSTTTGEGAVAVLSAPLGYNPLIPRSARINADQVTVLDAATGLRTGTLRMVDAHSIIPTGPGQAIIITDPFNDSGRMTRATLVGAPPT